MRVTFEAHGEVQFDREITRVGQRGANAAPVFGFLVNKFMEWEGEQFDTQGGRSSGGWAPLKEATVAAKKRNHLDERILHATHALRDSLTKPGAANQQKIVTDTFFVFGSTLAYAGAHQKGNPGGNLPQRRPLELTRRDRVGVAKWVQRYLITGDLPL